MRYTTRDLLVVITALCVLFACAPHAVNYANSVSDEMWRFATTNRSLIIFQNWFY